MTVPARLIDISTLPAELPVLTESLDPAFPATTDLVRELIRCDTIVAKKAGRRIKYLQLLVPPQYAFVPRGEQITPGTAGARLAFVRLKWHRNRRFPVGKRVWDPESGPLWWRHCNPHYPLPDLST